MKHKPTKKNEFFHNLFNNWWFIIGILMFLGTAISSIIRSLDGYGFFSNIYLSVDWIAACVIYFFIGGIIGHIIDYVRNRKIKHPLWFWLIIAFWVTSAVSLLTFADRTKISMAGILLFPLAYGIFLIGMTFTMILPDAIVKSSYGKFIFDMLFIAIFTFWTYYEYLYHKTDKKIVLRRILLLIIFAVFVIGFIGCATQLG